MVYLVQFKSTKPVRTSTSQVFFIRVSPGKTWRIPNRNLLTFFIKPLNYFLYPKTASPPTLKLRRINLAQDSIYKLIINVFGRRFFLYGKR
ncbi:MAG: hypothetical protein A2Z35_03780 [Actinobacteria bacterium RBG_19FT_COMBO_36_27]|nr:MAG: hypothetical protein A2Z35_03780 [Actinobacteria bacterium RBG_19FT_COMBO_36_27]